MNTKPNVDQTITDIGTHLPYLRRYARALTGNQDRGDRYAAATLEAILEDRSALDSDLPVKTALFKVMHGIWASARLDDPVDVSDGLAKTAQDRLSGLTANTREALLLRTIESFSFQQIAAIMEVDQDEAEGLIRIAHQEMIDRLAGRVLIIEDEPIIAMDLENIVAEQGHRITGVARTRDEAVALGKDDQPDLILADINLADNSSGIDAVNDLLVEFGDMPVIFITAYPERLLTGERPEPAFLITKPYTEEQIRSAVSQAMFFSSTETLKA
ncbi:MAG: response regulator [Pseudomonadota bacterium]